MTAIISAEEYTRPTLNVLMAISAELNSIEFNNQYTMFYLDWNVSNIVNIIVEHVVQFLLGGMAWRPRYFPQARISFYNEVDKIASITIYHTKAYMDWPMIHFVGYKQLDGISIANRRFGRGGTHTLDDYKIAVSHPNTIRILVQWEQNPSDELSQLLISTIDSIKRKNKIQF